MNGPSADELRESCETLAARDSSLARAYREIGLPSWRGTVANYETLARIVVYQLISTKAADAIWARVRQRYAQMTARAVLMDDPEAVRDCGLSRPKLQHLLAIASAVEDGYLDFEALAKAPIDDARKTLLKVRGIGPWTAETFLMNALGHLDAFPHGDVGLIEAHRRLSGAETRLSAKAFSTEAEQWRPYRAVAAHLLYDWYNAHRA
ncbi:MAG: DNA-3-methyladenine glycosylase 2 family protein [Pseudomonadota bacterium]